MFEDERFDVMLCCNDSRNGQFADRLLAIEIGENMSFESRGMPDDGPSLKYILAQPSYRTPCAINLAGRDFTISNHRPHVGNWCWDSAHMLGGVVLELLNWPTFREQFDIKEGETRLFQYWRNEGVWTDDDLRLIGKRFR